MKKSLLIAFYFLTGVITLPAQKKDFIINVPPCSKFNIVKFEHNAIDGTYEYRSRDSLKVIQTKMIDRYSEMIIQEGTPLVKRRYYYLSTGVLWSESNSFYNCVTGITRIYDESGKLISERNEDAPYSFSIGDVVKKVKQEFNVDLTKPTSHMDVNRGSDYSVAFGLRSGESVFSGIEAIMLDGTTGEIYYHAKGQKVFLDKTKD